MNFEGSLTVPLKPPVPYASQPAAIAEMGIEVTWVSAKATTARPF
jgi:hypothetical protein